MRKIMGFPLLMCASLAFAATDWHARAHVTLSQSYVILKPESGSVDEVDFHPNIGGQPGIEVRYKEYGLSMTPGVAGTSQFRSNRPPTKYSDYSLFYYGNAWGVEGYYQYFRGYHGDFGQGVGADHPSMTLNTALLNLYRSLYSRHYPQTESYPRPKLGSEPGGGIADLTGGTDIQGFHFNAFYMISGFRLALQSDRSFLDSSAFPSSAFGGMTRLNHLGGAASLGVNGGIFFNGLYASHTLLVGAGMQQTHSNVSVAEGFVPAAKIGGKSYGGYRTDRLNVGVLLHGDVTMISVTEHEAVRYTVGMVKLFAEVSF